MPKHEWRDIFITSDEDSSLNVPPPQEVFACTVQSVRMHPNTDQYPATAIVVEEDTDWLLPTWTTRYDSTDFKQNPLLKVKVGDVVRIGDTQSHAFSPHVTVMEIRHINQYINGANTDIITALGSQANDSSMPQGSEHKRPVGDLGIAHICLRISLRLNCTSMPTNIPTDSSIHDKPDEHEYPTVGSRHRVSAPLNSDSLQKYFYPLFVCTSEPRLIKADFLGSFTNCERLQLNGYTIRNKRNAGSEQAHEMPDDDYMVLNIKELEGTVSSNTQYTDRSFAVLPLQGGINVSNFQYEAGGLASKDLGGRSLRQITVKVTDRAGRPFHFGRLHLWFKLLVTQP